MDTLCGGMYGLLHQSKLKQMPNVSKGLQHAEATRRIVEEKYTEQLDEEKLLSTVKEKVLVQLANIRMHPCVAAGLALGKIILPEWVYQIETGSMFAYDFDQKQFLRIEEVGTVVQKVSGKAPLLSV